MRTVNYNDFIRECPTKLVSTFQRYVPASEDDSKWEHNLYKCVLKHGGRQYTFSYRMGMGHTSPPDLKMVIENMQSDSSGVEYSSFEEWARDHGYDEDSRRAEKIYHACEEQTRRLETLFGEHFETFQAIDWNE